MPKGLRELLSALACAFSVALALQMPSPTTGQSPAGRPPPAQSSTEQPPATPSPPPRGIVPMILDHNRMIVEVQVQRKDGTWRKALLWVDTGNPDFMLSEQLARDLGLAPPAEDGKPSDAAPSDVDVVEAPAVRFGGKDLRVDSVRTTVIFRRPWLFNTMHVDANLPSTVLMHYQVVFDYPQRMVTIGDPGSVEHRGLRAPAVVNPRTGIVQLDALVGRDSLSLALDNGASYSFVSAAVFDRLVEDHPEWPCSVGAVGCANIWGWWPGEPDYPITRLPEITWGSIPLAQVGLVGLPDIFRGGASLSAFYSQKAARAVDGFLGPNAFKAFCVEIDYPEGAVYFEKGPEVDPHDLDLVGLTLRPEADGGYSVIGVIQRGGRPAVEGVETGDTLLRIGDLTVAGATMGTVIDALRGRPGEVRPLVLGRQGKEIRVEAAVHRFL